MKHGSGRRRRSSIPTESVTAMLEAKEMALDTTAAFKSEIIAEVFARLSLHPQVFAALETPPWQMNEVCSEEIPEWGQQLLARVDVLQKRSEKCGTETAGFAPSHRIDQLERAVHDLQAWRSQVESGQTPQPPIASVATPCPVATTLEAAGSISEEAPGSRPPDMNSRSQTLVLEAAKPLSWKQGKQAIELEPSVWDTALLVGIDKQGWACAAWAAMVLFLNVFVQAFFAVIVVRELTSSKYTEDTAARFREWRINTGHAVQQLDLVNQIPMAVFPLLSACCARAHARDSQWVGGWVGE